MKGNTHDRRGMNVVRVQHGVCARKAPVPDGHGIADERDVAA